LTAILSCLLKDGGVNINNS